MEEAREVLLQALEQAGVTSPPGAELVQDLCQPAGLVAICLRALSLIEGASVPSISPFPASMSNRVRLCTEVASSIKHLGFIGDLRFHQFLYPVEEETHRLFRFLVDKVSTESDIANGHDIHTTLENNLTASSFKGRANVKDGDLNRLEEQLSILSSENVKLTDEVMGLNQHLKSVKVDLIQTKVSKTLRLSQQNLLDPKVEWESSKRILSESSALAENEELHLEDLEIVRHKIKETMVKLEQREEENEILARLMEKSVKRPSRSSYVSRITELIKNSKKQDADISRILGETWDLQREINANQGRLKRTYALVDELVFRDAKKDAASRQAYRLLTSIHENFASCYDTVFLLDKLHREIAEVQGNRKSSLLKIGMHAYVNKAPAKSIVR
ncbi:hypothetical protein GOP47_0007390 [Adiantum capillus-veneris]|uniref:Coiled-coil domain-containing protein 22 homolog n=1 Tax=Adiantum capillus-veneris TaxID=13818 RepID=A0A9D4V0L2_ADICA|nr:hypothetical protein GOP47_0007390 [Adiantum capillus-veneris]